ncbi:hypothetical protein GCM10028784_16940 [Myceligenerans cantabricum]
MTTPGAVTPPAADTPKQDADPATSGAQRWTKAGEAIQTTAKWVITALAAVGAVMFAKGFVTTPPLSVQHDLPQLFIAWLLGVAGVVGVGLLIWSTSRTLFPHVLTLGSLPAEFRHLVDQDPADHLPSDASSVEEFEQGLRRYRRAALLSPDRVRQAEQDAAAARKGRDSARTQEAENWLTTVRAQAATITANRDLYLAKREELLERAQFWQASHGYSKRSLLVILGAILAAGGGIGYQLALSTPAQDDDPSADPAAVTPRTAQLVQLETEASLALWEAAGLAECEIAGTDSPTVIVTVLAGDGSQDSPYSVSTTGNDTCHQRTFPVISDVALLVEEPAITITFTPTEPAAEERP